MFQGEVCLQLRIQDEITTICNNKLVVVEFLRQRGREPPLPISTQRVFFLLRDSQAPVCHPLGPFLPNLSFFSSIFFLPPFSSKGELLSRPRHVHANVWIIRKEISSFFLSNRINQRSIFSQMKEILLISKNRKFLRGNPCDKTSLARMERRGRNGPKRSPSFPNNNNISDPTVSISIPQLSPSESPTRQLFPSNNTNSPRASRPPSPPLPLFTNIAGEGWRGGESQKSLAP